MTSQNERSSPGNCLFANPKVLIETSFFTGEELIEALFITRRSEFLTFADAEFQHWFNNEPYELCFSQVMRQVSDDDGLIEKLEEIFGLNVCGTHLIEAIRASIREKIRSCQPDPTRCEFRCVAGAVTNSFDMTLVPIPFGSCPTVVEGLDATVAQPLYLGEFLVTQAVFERVMGWNPSWFQGDNGSTLDFPVESVTAFEAEEFCRRLTELPSEKDAGRSYRLPTEQEWVYAARAGTRTEWYFGDDLAELPKHAWFDREGHTWERPHKVGLKSPNPFGLYDLYGNVEEWCALSDWGQGTDWFPPEPPSKTDRITRGGSYLELEGCHWAYPMNYRDGSARDRSIGFRVAMTFNSPSA